MQISSVARAGVGAAGAAATAVWVTISAPSASAMNLSPSQAYCAGTTYTIHVPAAEVAQLVSAYPVEKPTEMSFYDDAPGAPAELLIAAVPIIPGHDIDVQWTPAYSGNVMMRTYLSSSSSSFLLGPAMSVPVVQSAPSGASCTPMAGSAASVPYVGVLLGGLSA